MRWIQQFDLFLFDLDGLLVDTERLHFQAYQTLCAQYNVDLTWDYMTYLEVAHLSHDGLKNSLLPLLGKEDWASLYAKKKQVYQELLSKGEVTLMPGVEKLLQELALTRKKRCVVTHSAKEQVRVIQNALPILQTIPMWLTREDYEHPKPAPDGYAKAIEILSDPGDKIIGFEDSLRGIQSLQGTEALPILICDPNHPQLQVDSLKDVATFPSLSKINR